VSPELTSMLYEPLTKGKLCTSDIIKVCVRVHIQLQVVVHFWQLHIGRLSIQWLWIGAMQRYAKGATATPLGTL